MKHLSILSVVLIIACTSTIPPLTLKGSAPLTDPNVKIYFDSSICGLTKEEMIIYPSAELGVSYHYSTDSIKAAFYVFNGGQKVIENGCNSDIIKSCFSQTLRDIYIMQKYGFNPDNIKSSFPQSLQEFYLMQKYGNYQMVTAEEQLYDTLRINNENIQALFVRCTISSGDVPRSSYVLLTGYNNQIIKIRYTYKPLSSESANVTWKCILSSLGDSIFVSKSNRNY
jgi:hypothetical protein